MKSQLSCNADTYRPKSVSNLDWTIEIAIQLYKTINLIYNK